MRRPFILVTGLVLSVLISTFLIWQPKFSSAQTDDPRPARGCSAEAPRQLEFAYYSLRDGFSSTLLLVSGSPKPLEFVMAIHGRSGQTLLAPAMTIQPHEKLTVDVAALLTNLSADVTGDFAEGSVSIYFSGTIMPLAGQLTMVNPARSLSLESEMVDNSPGLGLLPPLLHGVWWGLGGGREATIMVSNTSGDAATADVFLDFLAERHESPPLVFAPHEIKVLSITQLLGDLKVSPAQAPEGGITIIPRGPEPALIASGKMIDPGRGFSTTLDFLDPSLERANALHATGVLIGTPSKDSPFTGTGTFIPHVVVRNLQGAAQTATVTIEYPAPEGPAQTVLAPLPLDAYSTKDIPLDAVFGLLPLPLPYCSIRIQYSGPPGSVVGEVSSIEAKGDLVIDSRLANEGNGWAGSGGNPWHLDEETEAIQFLTNMGDRDVRIGYVVSGGGVNYYLTDLKLKSHETRAIDIRKLRDAQEPDFQGNVLPAGATDGSVIWNRIEHVPVMGQLMVLKRRQGMASPYTCFMCNCGVSFQLIDVTPVTLGLLPTQTGQDTATGMYFNCNATALYYNVTGSSSWWSKNTPVATVNNTTYKGRVTGQSGGTAGIWASFTDQVVDNSWYPDYACHYYPQTSSDNGNANVYDATMSSAKSIYDGLTATFSVTPIGGTPTSYAWSFTSPSGAGNSPNVTFTPSNAQITTTNGRWFALPNGACTASASAVYTIKSTVTFPGGLQKIPQTTLTVNLWQTAGLEPPPYVQGYPAYVQQSQNLWVVTGQGSLSRSVQSPIINYTSSSQFYNKVVAHENKHVLQWTSGMNVDLYVVSNLMSQLSPLTDPTENGLKAKISNTWNTWSLSQQTIHQSRHSAMETEAYAVSDPIAPQYYYQGSCGDRM